jgi:alkanesulfonate monooxygenase SsuD/methylene tetrahydromethanopterin reductase-like flavin-dependent oxidoreductase (luciferase family)
VTQGAAASGMKVGIVLRTTESGPEGTTPTFRAIAELAKVAERAGLDSIWLPDHLLFRASSRGEVFWEAFTMLGALAAVTTRITLGTIVVSTSFRPPALVAKIAATLNSISGGRLILGLGAGWYQPEYEAFGYPFDHLASRFEEAMRIIALLLCEGQVDFQGQYDKRPYGLCRVIQRLTAVARLAVCRRKKLGQVCWSPSHVCPTCARVTGGAIPCPRC